MRTRMLIASATVIALVAASCGSDDDAADTTQAPSPTQAPSDTSESDTTEPEATDAPSDTEAQGEPAEVTGGPGVTDSEIHVAVLNDFSGPIASIGTPAAIGSEMYFDSLNAAGGVCGRDVVVERADTKYDTQVAIQEYRAVKDDVAFITQLLGTGTVFALANDLERDQLTTLAGTLAAGVIPLPYVYVYQTPFPLEAINAMAWVGDEMGTDAPVKVGVIYQNDAYGEEGLHAIEYAAETENIEIVATAPYSPTDEDFTSQVQAMIDGGAEVVWMHDTPRQTAGILGVAAQLGFAPMFMSNSSGYSSALAEPLGALLDNFRVVNSNSSIISGDEEIETMIAAHDEYAADVPLDNWMVTGWISGKVTHAALERACEMGDLSREGIAEAMVGLEVDMNGIAPNISFGETPDERIPARAARVNSIDAESGLPTPVSEYIESEAALAWTLP